MRIDRAVSRRLARVIPLVAGLAMGTQAMGQFVQQFEDFATDPAGRGWSGVNNTTAPQNYGFRTSDLTGTTVSPPVGSPSAGGEIGGSLARSSGPVNFYGVDIGAGLDINDTPFYVSGVLRVQRDGGSGFYLGYSNGISSYGSGGDAANFMGVQFDDGDFPIPISFDPNSGRDRNLTLSPIASGQTFPFVLDYDPNGNGGNGALSVTIGSQSTVFTGFNNADFLPFTHFGLMPVSADGGTAQIYIDDLYFTRAGTPGEPQWNSPASGDWLSAGNWAGPVPNATDAQANFLGVITAPRTVFADTGVTVGRLRFENINTYVLAGAGSLTIDVSTGSGSILVQQGSHKINLPLFVTDDTTADIAAGAKLTIADPMTLANGSTLTKTGDGQLDIISLVSSSSPSAALVPTAGTTNVHFDMGSEVTVNATGGTTNLHSSQHLDAVLVSGGARLNVVTGGNRMLRSQSLNVSGASQLDLANNRAIVDYTGASPVAAIASSITSGFAGGAWNGDGINSSNAAATPNRAVGYAEAADLGITSFGGEPVDGTAVLIRYTILGDANLDGVTNIGDFSLLGSNFNQAGGWSKGDFNYNGTVNIGDFSLLAANFNQSVGADGARGAAVPEPASLAVAAVACGLLLRRRPMR